MSTNNVCFNGKIRKIIPELLPNTSPKQLLCTAALIPPPYHSPCDSCSEPIKTDKMRDLPLLILLLYKNKQKRKFYKTITTLWANSANYKLMIIFLIFPIKQDLVFHANCLYWRYFVWNDKTCFLGKNKKNISIWYLLTILLRVLSVKNQNTMNEIQKRITNSLMLPFVISTVYLRG